MFKKCKRTSELFKLTNENILYKYDTTNSNTRTPEESIKLKEWTNEFKKYSLLLGHLCLFFSPKVETDEVTF